MSGMSQQLGVLLLKDGLLWFLRFFRFLRFLSCASLSCFSCSRLSLLFGRRALESECQLQLGGGRLQAALAKSFAAFTIRNKNQRQGPQTERSLLNRADRFCTFWLPSLFNVHAAPCTPCTPCTLSTLHTLLFSQKRPPDTPLQSVA